MAVLPSLWTAWKTRALDELGIVLILRVSVNACRYQGIAILCIWVALECCLMRIRDCKSEALIFGLMVVTYLIMLLTPSIS